MDTRHEDYKFNYTSEVSGNIVTDLNIVRNVTNYLVEALRNYVLMEFYDTIGHEKKANKYKLDYHNSRGYVAFWAKSDLSLATSRTAE
jgi:hypothetical protein